MVRMLLAAATAIGFAASHAVGDPEIDAILPQSSSQDDYRFTRDLRPGQTLGISNIDGDVVVTQGTGRTAVVSVEKRVIRGNGDLVMAIMEETEEGIRVCTVYLQAVDEQRTTCRGTKTTGRHAPLEVEMTYAVTLPPGTRLSVGTVDGNLRVSSTDTPGRITTVDGDVDYRGVMPEKLSSVDGSITLEVTGPVDDDADISTVDGDITLTLPGSVALDVRASTIDGSLESDFPLTMSGKYGPRNLRGTINGGGATLRLSTIDGSIQIRRGR